jgi:dephospho-CoA kinase
MLKVGLTGGYATGKSFVAAELGRLGCLLIYADQLGHHVLEKNGEAYEPTLKVFGPGILQFDGSIDRKKLAAMVFASPELLTALSSFVHPAVLRLEAQILESWKLQHPNGIAVMEAAILIETGRYTAFDRMILVACDPETQIARGMKRDHLTREEVLARLARQMPLEEKKKYAHYVINTNGAKEDTIRQVDEVFRDLKQLAGSAHA